MPDGTALDAIHNLQKTFWALVLRNRVLTGLHTLLFLWTLRILSHSQQMV